MASNLGRASSFATRSQELEASRQPPASKTGMESVQSKSHAERSECVCRMCRKARMLERRSWEPLTFRDKVYVYTALWSGVGILVLFLLAALAS